MASQLVSTLKFKEKIEVVCSSAHPRCIATVRPLAKALGLQVLVFPEFGSLEFKLRKEEIDEHCGHKPLEQLSPAEIAAYEDLMRPSFDKLIELVGNFPCKNILICTHGEIIAFLRSRAEQKPLKNFSFEGIGYGKIFKLVKF